MKLTITPLPPVARQAYPKLADLVRGFLWYKDASPKSRQVFEEARLKLVGEGVSPDVEAKEQITSGSTGIQKHYRWGPNFYEADRFFHLLVKEGDRLHKTAHLHVTKITQTEETNTIELVEVIDSYNIQKNCSLSIHGYGEIPDLRKELAGHNIYTNPSMFSLLDKYINFRSMIDKDALIIFTGEALPTELESSLRKDGFDVRDEMRCWDGGATFYTCRFGNKHWIDFLSRTWTDNEEKLYASDFFNLSQPHVNYHNGDIVHREFGERCKCGMINASMTFRNRADYTLFHTPSGIMATYTALCNTFLAVTKVPAEKLTVLCFGKYPGEIDKRLIINYLIEGYSEDDHREIHQIVKDNFFAIFGLRVILEKWVHTSYYKIKKVYWIEA